MAILSLIYGTKKILKIAAIEVDVCISEQHELQAEVTENPVESGSVITDHVQVKPIKISIEGLVSDTPIRFLSGVISLFEDTRSIKTYDELQKIMQAREPITVNTGLKQYKNMVLTSLSIPRTVDTGKALKFTAQFQEIITVYTEEISIVSDTKFDSKKDLGKNTPSTPTSATDGSGSVLSDITGAGA